MESNYNNLTPAQVEALASLAEEMGEAIQIIGKILRHGYEEYSPFDEKRTTNRMLLQKELGDVEYWIDYLATKNEVDSRTIEDFTMAKAKSVAPYLHHCEPLNYGAWALLRDN